MDKRAFLKTITCLAILLTHVSPSPGSDFFELLAGGTVEQVRQAIKDGADVNARDADGLTPLMLAVGARIHINPNPNAEIVRLLIYHGADVRAEYEFEMPYEPRLTNTALHWAASRLPEVVPDLLDAGAGIDDIGLLGTPLMIAITRSREYPEIVYLLLQRGADINAEHPMFGTALSRALSHTGTTPEVVITLLDAGADVHYVSPHGWTILMEAVWGIGGAYAYSFFPLRYSIPILKRILDSGVPVNQACYTWGTTALMLAAMHGAREVVSLLIRSGADTAQRDFDGRSAYDHARINRRFDNADMIFFNGSSFQFYLARDIYILCWLVLIVGFVVIGLFYGPKNEKILSLTMYPIIFLVLWWIRDIFPLHRYLNHMSMVIWGLYFRYFIVYVKYPEELPGNASGCLALCSLAISFMAVALFVWTVKI